MCWSATFQPSPPPEPVAVVLTGFEPPQEPRPGETDRRLELPGGIKLAFPDVRVKLIKFASPGMLDLIGASGILKQMKEMYELHMFRDERRLKMQLDNDLTSQKIAAEKIDNLERSVKVMKKLGYTEKEIRGILGHADQWINEVNQLNKSGKITAIELKKNDDPS